jgi:hypothetical protein
LESLYVEAPILTLQEQIQMKLSHAIITISIFLSLAVAYQYTQTETESTDTVETQKSEAFQPNPVTQHSDTSSVEVATTRNVVAAEQNIDEAMSEAVSEANDTSVTEETDVATQELTTSNFIEQTIDDDWVGRTEVKTQELIYDMAADKNLNLHFDDVSCESASCLFDVAIANEYNTSGNKNVAQIMGMLTTSDDLKNNTIKLKRFETIDGETKMKIAIEKKS